MIYLCGNSLGLQPQGVSAVVGSELRDWARLAVGGHFREEAPWYSYHELLRDPAARVVGARPDEVVIMNSLTVNLHLMMTSFYRPTKERYKVFMEAPAFPSDTYAVKSQLQWHGYDPAEALVIAGPRAGEQCLRTEDIEERLQQDGERIALVMLGGVNFITGQFFDIPRITSAAQAAGCVVGLDLAHAAGNVPLKLHDWGVDFAVWCTYKYLNSGPGAAGGCFVHSNHGNDPTLQRFAGWWGNDPDKRFRMHLEPEFVPQSGAAGWQISNPSILSMAPMRASLGLFDQAGMDALRAKSIRLTGYLEFLLNNVAGRPFETITPGDVEQRGCQLSIVVSGHGARFLQSLIAAGVVCDFREPNVIRAAPVPLYNSYQDVWNFVEILKGLVA